MTIRLAGIEHEQANDTKITFKGFLSISELLSSEYFFFISINSTNLTFKQVDPFKLHLTLK